MAHQAQLFEQWLQRQVAVQVGALPVLEGFLTTLQVRQTVNHTCPTQAAIDWGRVVEVLVSNRLTAPKPLYQVEEWLATTALPTLWELDSAKFNDDRLGRCLDALYPLRDDLWAQLITRAVLHYDLEVSELFYDFTSFYFEGEYADNDFITYGYSHDERPHTQQVVVGMDVTADGGVPLDYRLLAGNTAEVSTVVENMQRLRRLLRRCGKPLKVLVTSDAGLLCEEIIAAYHRKRMGYLGRLAEHKEVQELMRSVSQEEWLQHPLAYKPVRLLLQPEPAYYGVVRAWPVRVGAQTVSDQALVVYSPRKEKLDVQKREQGLEKLLKGLAHIASQLNQRKYKRADYVRAQIARAQQGNPARGLMSVTLEGEEGQLRLHYQVEAEALAQAQALEGKYVLASNRSRLSADEMLERFKGRDVAEKRNQVLKGPLRVRPVFLHTPERIASLVLVVMVALLIYTLLERVVRQRLDPQMTARQVLGVMGSWMAIGTEFADGSQSWQLAPLTPMQARIVRALVSARAKAKLLKRLAVAQPP